MTRPWRTGSIRFLAALIGVMASGFATIASHLWSMGDLPAALIMRRSWLATLRQFQGVPIEFGLVAGFALIALISISVNAQSRLRAAAFVVATALFGVSLGLVWANPRAIALWFSTAAAVVILWQAQRGTESEPSLALSELPRRLAAGLSAPGARTGLAIWALAAVVLAQFLSSRAGAISRTEAENRELSRWFLAAAPIQEQTLLPSGATHRLVVFSDYQCPACRAMVPQFRSAVSAARLRGTPVEIDIRDFPLAAGCNRAATSTLHPLACEMATAARVVRERLPDQDLAFEAWLFRQKDDLTVAELQTKLTTMGIVADELRRPDLLKAVEADASLGAAVGVVSTPTAFLDGVRLPALTPNGISSLLSGPVPQRREYSAVR